MNTCQKNRRPAVFRLIILASAVLLVAFGIVRGEAGAVLSKAASICLECIGIG